MAKEPTLEELLEKQEAGKKLSNKERRLIEKLERKAEIAAEEAEIEKDALRAFTLSLAGVEEGDTGALSTTDVIVNKFSISAPKMDLFVNANLKLVKDRKYGLLGPNGKGKTTLLRFLEARRLPVPEKMDILLVEQEKTADETPIVEQVLKSHERREGLLVEERKIMEDMEQQYKLSDSKVEKDNDDESDDDGIIPTWAVEDWVEKNKRLDAVIEELGVISSDSAEPRVRQILKGLGFTESMMNFGTTTLSGGWRMRVALAAALFIEPKLMLLDEPTNHLDLNATLWLERYLAKKSRSTILTVSHDQDFLDTVCTDLIQLQDQQLNYFGNGLEKFRLADQILFNKRMNDYEAQEKEMLRLKTKGQKTAKEAIEIVSKKNGGRLLERPKPYSVNFKFLSPEDNKYEINVNNVSFSYPGSNKVIFNNLNFGVDSGDRIAIVGDNGSGKTTLLNLMTKKLEATDGEVNMRRGCIIARYDQHFEEHLDFAKTPVDFIRAKHNLPEEKARASLGQFGLEGSKHLIPIASLSGGQKSRVVLASIALERPHILLLDEPTNHLDLESVEALIEGIKQFSGGVILVSHDARLIESTKCRLFIVPGDKSVIEFKGEFAEYRESVYKKIDEAEIEAEKKMLELQAKKTEEREAKKKQYEKYIKSQKAEIAQDEKKKERKRVRVRVEKKR